MKLTQLIFNFFVNRNWKQKMTDSRKRAKILADNRKGHHAIETLIWVFKTCLLLPCYLSSLKKKTLQNLLFVFVSYSDVIFISAKMIYGMAIIDTSKRRNKAIYFRFR